MSADPPERIGPHDLGGMPFGPVDGSAEHDAAYWERSVDAMVMLMLRRGLFEDAARLRHGIESLGPQAYQRLSYYERWAASAAATAIDKGLVTRQELEARIAQLRLRREGGR